MPNNKGPLESLKLNDHCEMCGSDGVLKPHTFHSEGTLEAAFDPAGEPKTLCRSCRIGSAELLDDLRSSLFAVCRSLVKYGPQYPPSSAAREEAKRLITKVNAKKASIICPKVWTVQEFLDAFNRAKNKNAPVDIINNQGDYVAESEFILTVDEDQEGEEVHIVVAKEIGL
jgi:hypothetical protein